MKTAGIRKTAEYALLCLISAVFILPLLLLFMQSFSVFSGSFSAANYLQVLGKPRNIQSFVNGLYISFSASLLAVPVALSASLALSRGKRHESGVILSLIL
jgi:ABC-type spermidine/putrescine transport system permease subunit II